MSLDGIIGGFAHYQRFQSSSRDDDFVDHLNHIYTVILLVVLAIFVSGKQYVGNPIECFSEDQEFGYSKREYTRTYCWLKNTYRASHNLPLPRDVEDREKAEVPYYQWVPIILLVMAVMFKLPNLLWRAASAGHGLDLTRLADLINQAQLMAPDKSGEAIRQMAGYLDRWLSSHHHVPSTPVNPGTPKVSDRCRCCYRVGHKRRGFHLTGLYMMSKFMFLANSLTVLGLLWHVLGSWYVDFGLRLLMGKTTGQVPRGDLADGDNDMAWPELPFFPKLTYCDITVRQQANLNVHTLQCALPINMFNEKIFGFLWFWITLVSVANVVSLGQWLLKTRFGSLHGEYIRRVLDNHGDLITGYDTHLALTFGHNYLRSDGCFAFHVILKNSNSLLAADLLSELFDIYRKKTAVVKKEKGCGDIMYI